MSKFNVQRITVAFALVLSLLAASPVHAQNDSSEDKQGAWWLFEQAGDRINRLWKSPSERLKGGEEVRSAFRGLVAETSQATVRVRSGGKDLALGGIVGPDGWVLTKASRIQRPVTVRLKDSRELDARVVGVDRDNDLAMLKVAAKDLPSLALDEEAAAAAGAWVATPGPEDTPVAVGVVSVAPRRIRPRTALLGVVMEDEAEDQGGALITKVFPNSGAERAGVLVQDIIIRVNGAPIGGRDDLRKEVQRYSPGDEIEMVVRRGKQQVTVMATLTGRVEPGEARREYQNNLGGELSVRRTGFPLALQHDTVLKPADCGGPLVDLDGRVIGFNIARAGRTESYAIPVKAVLPLMYELMSGKQAPPPIFDTGS